VIVSEISWEVATRRELFGIPWFPHGALIAVGFVVGSWMLVRAARREGVDVEALVDVLTWVATGGLIGTRLFWVLGNWAEVGSIGEALMVWHGGMTLFGGIAGGAIAGVVGARRHGLPTARLLDLAMPGLAVGIAIGRVSDLVIGDHLGKPTGLPWGFRYVGVDPPGTPPPVGAVVHPVALYDMVLVSLLAAVLVVFLRRPRAIGSGVALFAAWYSVQRLALDLLRTDPVRAIGLTGTQLASLAVLAAVIGSLAFRARALAGGAHSLATTD
jgi:phosphatidylglycerol:prolipoprotein diacylglycerol transferase